MAQGGRNDPSQNADSEARYLVAGIVVIGTLLFGWWLARGWLVRGAFGIAWLELWVAKLTVGLGERGNGALDIVSGTLTGRYDAWEVPFSVLRTVKAGAGEKVSYLIVGAIIVMAGWCMFRMQGSGYTSKHDMNSLATIQALSWRTLTPGANFKADTAPAEWDQARRPTDWIKDNGISLKGGVLDEDKVTEVLITHLGNVWHGFTPDLPVHIRLLVVIFALHHVGKATKVDGERKPYALILREDAAVLYGDPKMPAAERDAKIEALIKPFMGEKHMKSAIENVTNPKLHAYVNTALFAQLTKARKRRGVLAAGEFNWLKGIDRTLWYVMNNCGRRAYHVEGGGAVAHYDAERVAGAALIEPHVMQATFGVRTYFTDHRLTDIDAFLKGETPEPWEQ